MKDGNTNLAQKKIIIFFSVLGVIIVGLIIAIVVVKLIPRGDDAEITQETYNDCMKDQNEFIAMEGYPYDKIMEAYDKKMSEHDDFYNLNYSVCYANFVYSTYNDIDTAIEIMSNGENYLDEEADDNTKMSFYSSFEYFYQEAGEPEMAELYYSFVKQFATDDSPEEEEEE